MTLARARQIDAILLTERSRWGCETIDLLDTVRELEGWKISAIAMNGMTFNLSSPHGLMLATIRSGVRARSHQRAREIRPCRCSTVSNSFGGSDGILFEWQHLEGRLR
nr:recombinase family protein [Ensifer sp. IC4062]